MKHYSVRSAHTGIWYGSDSKKKEKEKEIKKFDEDNSKQKEETADYNTHVVLISVKEDFRFF